MEIVSIGFRAKTAKAIAVALAGQSSSPAYIGRWNVCLFDPLFPATGQPHHGVMELPWADAKSAVQPLERRIENVAIQTMASLIRDLEQKGCRVNAVGVVGSPDRDLER